MKYYYHFTGDKLRDGRPIPPIGEWLEHHGELSICQSGLHASPCPWWAYVHAPGTMLHLVELGGTVLTDRFLGDIVCASRRRIIASFDAAGLFRDFARYCAREVAHFWDPPKTVRRWLDTGDTKHLAAVTRYAQRMTRGKETSRTDVKLAARGAESASEVQGGLRLFGSGQGIWRGRAQAGGGVCKLEEP